MFDHIEMSAVASKVVSVSITQIESSPGDAQQKDFTANRGLAHIESHALCNLRGMGCG
jgi:hypothetical protein